MFLSSLFLAQSYQDTWDDYSRSLASEDASRWDYIVLTASDEGQAEAFSCQLEDRRAAGALPVGTRFLVVPDEGGRRIGSGGATLGVLAAIVRDRGGVHDFSGLSVLVIHSGGDSKRIPQYSVLGKLFSPVPRVLPDGRASTLFDEIVACMASVPGRIREGMLVVSGDVLLLFNPLQIDYSGRGAAAISFKEDVETGCRHGVFLNGAGNYVSRFLHKQSVESLRAVGAVNERNCIDIDTGAVIFSTEMMGALWSLIADGAGDFEPERYAALVNDRVRLSFYADFLFPLAADSTWEDFLKEEPEGRFCPELEAARGLVWKALRPYRLRLLRLAPAKFIHFGTTAEFLALFSRDIGEYESLGWRKDVASSLAGDTAGYASILEAGASVAPGCYLEACHVHSGSRIGQGTVLSHIEVIDESVPENTVVHGIRLRDGDWAVRIYGVTDNPKAAAPEAPFLGTTLAAFMETNRIAPDELWLDGEVSRTLWNARLFPVCGTMREALAAALNVAAMARGNGNPVSWRASRRVSLQAGFAEASCQAALAWQRRMRELVAVDRIDKAIDAGTPVRNLTPFPGKNGSLSDAQRIWLDERLANADFGKAMRLHYYIGALLGGNEGTREIVRGFHVLQGAMLEASQGRLVFNDRCRIVCDRHQVSLPLRVNWGGGWSDTPPYCLEHGGTVLNAAILLQGRRPVEVTLERIDSPEIIFESTDMDVRASFSSLDELRNTGNPHDAFALQKAALLACGIVPKTGGSLPDLLKRLGGGFFMKSQVVGVPQGSGLGTSSILAATCAKALLEFVGITCSEDDIYARVLCMEQIMSTGGGWQDQVGGVTDGIKFITSRPGLNQILQVEHLALTPQLLDNLNARFALIYTGQRRLARNILRNVIGNYLGNAPESLQALAEIQCVAADMRTALLKENVDDFAALMNRHWKLSLMIDAGSTNTLINHIFAVIDDLIDGRMVCGAGGGGFLQVILRKGVSREALHTRLKDVFQDNPVDVWDCRLI